MDVSHYLTDWLLDLHYKFLLNTSGAAVGAVVAILFLFLGGSGIYLYRHFWRHFFTLRFGKAKRILFSDIHKMIPIYDGYRGLANESVVFSNRNILLVIVSVIIQITV